MENVANKIEPIVQNKLHQELADTFLTNALGYVETVATDNLAVLFGGATPSKFYTANSGTASIDSHTLEHWHPLHQHHTEAVLWDVYTNPKERILTFLTQQFAARGLRMNSVVTMDHARMLTALPSELDVFLTEYRANVDEKATVLSSFTLKPSANGDGNWDVIIRVMVGSTAGNIYFDLTLKRLVNAVSPLIFDTQIEKINKLLVTFVLGFGSQSDFLSVIPQMSFSDMVTSAYMRPNRITDPEQIYTEYFQMLNNNPEMVINTHGSSTDLRKIIAWKVLTENQRHIVSCAIEMGSAMFSTFLKINQANAFMK